MYHPQDLFPVIPPDSDTARSIAEVRRSETGGAWLGAAAGICALAGGSLLAVSLAQRDRSVPLWPGLTIGIGGTLVFGFAAAGASKERDFAAAKAYESYDRSLQRRLSICIEPNCPAETH